MCKCKCHKLLCYCTHTMFLCAICVISPYLWWGLVVQTPKGSAARYSCSRHKAGYLEGCSPQRKYTDRGLGKGYWQAPHGHGWYCRHTSPGHHLLRCHRPGRQTALRKAHHMPWRRWMPSSCQSWSPRCLQSAGCKGLPVGTKEMIEFNRGSIYTELIIL